MPPLLPANASTTLKKFHSTGNPILADGSIYSADPAPLVVNGTVYILSGRDEAGPIENAFIMNEWQVFEAQKPDAAGGDWLLHRDIARPHEVFLWADEGYAYAGQIVQAANGKFYLYAPVMQSNTTSDDPFGIGVAVSDSPLGPFIDAHPSGPIISQSVPAPGNNIQNIDPTVLIDTDGRVFIYFGTFGQLRGYELEQGMMTIKGSVVTVKTLTGFFEAPWLMKRKNDYYMLYAANNAGADSPCTPTSYHACLAYGTASSPLGPWSFQGVFMGIVSSTTSHPGVYERDGEWFLVYHTRDAEGGTHFRRSIAFDKLRWDDSTNPPSIIRVVQTHRPSKPRQPSRNIAPLAKASSNIQTPIQYWIAALNDERVDAAPLPPDYWSSYAAEQLPQNVTLTYTWNSTVQLNGVKMVFFADQDAGSNIGVPPPKEWKVEYLDVSKWKAVEAGVYPVQVADKPKEVRFTTVETTAIRAVLTASGGDGQFGGIGVKEWEALAPKAV
ncbi:glycosyl hydrolase [Thelonectria olida]|uniref:Glycosyl hydrolase n=1 Tax=Thelonectria olida TaxID=1576542 RepID=A0A9P9AIZ9_9HYPO|nr:glycosyl hydrolase [Thelonectria olida]